jgi:hypothetical protein
MRCSAIFVSRACVRAVLPKHSWVSFYCDLHHFTSRKLSFLLHLLSDFCARNCHQVLHFTDRGRHKSSLGHFGRIQGLVHVWLFQLDPTSLPCHSSRHVGNLQEISCCLQQWYLATTSTIYTFLASAKMTNACIVHFFEWLLHNPSMKIAELATSSYSILREARPNAFVAYGGFPLWVAIYWSYRCSSVLILALCYMVSC